MEFTVDFKKALEGRGQKASDLPEDYRCFTEAEVEGIVSEILLRVRADQLNRSMANLMGGING